MNRVLLTLVALVPFALSVQARDLFSILLEEGEGSSKKTRKASVNWPSGIEKIPSNGDRQAASDVKTTQEDERVQPTPAQVVTVTNVVEKPVEVERVVMVTNVVEKPVEVERVVTVTNVVEKPVEVERVVTVTNVVEKPVEIERVVTVTNVVEKVVVDKEAEARLRRQNEKLEDRSSLLEAKNTDLNESNERLQTALALERQRRERLERALPKGQKATGRPAKISSDSTYYDRAEGFAVFTGNVHVNDEQYQLHADRAYVFMSDTNSLKRIVAIGHVAMTNDTKRAYGAKISYYKESGMVVLYSGDGIVAEVRDESKVDDQYVRGEKIKFWTGSEQVEVLKATILTPSEGTSDVMGAGGLR